MRLFIAVHVDAAVVASAMELVEQVRQRARTQAPAARITWAAPDRLHLTLAFIGSVGDPQAARIMEALRPPLAMAPFHFRVRGAGTFPERGAPRVIWVAVEEGRTALAELARTVTERLAAVGVPPEERAFHPHLTLARVREPAGLRARTLLDGLGDVDLGTSAVDAITLFESRLSPKGPTYVGVQRTALGV